MATINEIKEQMIVVNSVGEFTNALQQIATLRMMRLRDQVMAARAFVETANELLSELTSLRNALHTQDLLRLEKKSRGVFTPESDRTAVIVITSNQGLTGRYNIEIYQKIEKILEQEKGSDFYVIGKKGQEYFQNGKYKVTYYPYEVPDTFGTQDLQRLTTIFDYYQHITLIYSHYVNSATRDVVALSVVSPSPVEKTPAEEPVADEVKGTKPGKKEKKKEERNKWIYEPDIDRLIDTVTKRLRNALFQQQIFDARLSQNSAQMIGMKTASDNATTLLADLKVDYNKQRRKMIDKKISEVFAGSALW